ncbi:hypothetical protein [Pedobacter nutrimenti]|uniref:hypothetical protein n=1 Tax=Pedobacter nutrimenti TaxID=1241337 RepID=UPI00293089C8|nr:hypothetical protein [Pedobacter nutrimenti]
MKKLIFSLLVVCTLTAFSSEKMINVVPGSNLQTSSKSLVTIAPVTYRNLKANAGYLVIYDITTGQTYSTSLAPTTGTLPVNTGIQLAIGDQLEVTLYSGNGDSSLKFQSVTQTGVSSLYISSIYFLPSPSMIVIQ